MLGPGGGKRQPLDNACVGILLRPMICQPASADAQDQASCAASSTPQIVSAAVLGKSEMTIVKITRSNAKVIMGNAPSHDADHAKHSFGVFSEYFRLNLVVC